MWEVKFVTAKDDIFISTSKAFIASAKECGIDITMEVDGNHNKHRLLINNDNKSLVYALMKEITELKEEIDVLSEKNENFSDMLRTMCNGCIFKRKSLNNKMH